MKVMVGGTFDLLHIGHQALLKCAFETAGTDGSVRIGLSSDEFAARKDHPVQSYDTRRKELSTWIAKSGFTTPYIIEPLHDPFGSACREDFDVLVVSYETSAGGKLINQKREEAGLKPVMLQEVACVCADDGKPVSSTRIHQGIINKLGEKEN